MLYHISCTNHVQSFYTTDIRQSKHSKQKPLFILFVRNALFRLFDYLYTYTVHVLLLLLLLFIIEANKTYLVVTHKTSVFALYKQHTFKIYYIIQVFNYGVYKMCILPTYIRIYNNITPLCAILPLKFSQSLLYFFFNIKYDA